MNFSLLRARAISSTRAHLGHVFSLPSFSVQSRNFFHIINSPLVLLDAQSDSKTRGSVPFIADIHPHVGCLHCFSSPETTWIRGILSLCALAQWCLSGGVVVVGCCDYFAMKRRFIESATYWQECNISPLLTGLAMPYWNPLSHSQWLSPLTVLLHWYEWGLPSPVQHGEGHGFRDLLPVNPPASVAHQERLLYQVISTWFFCTLLLWSTFPHNIFFHFFLMGTSMKFSRLKWRRGVLIVESHIQTFFI